MKQDPCPAIAEVAKPAGIGFDPSGNTMAMINGELATTTARLAAPGNAMQLGIIPQRIATLWEVKTARLQTIIGDPNAGLGASECYELHSYTHSEYAGWVSISCLKSMPVPANEPDWRGVA